MTASHTHCRLARAAASALAGVVLAMVVTSPAGATADEEATLYALINASRASEALIPLQHDAAASAVARAWAEHMATTDELFHNPNLAAEVTRDVTTDWQRLGENVGYTHGDAAKQHQNYMESPGHRANIMGDFTHVGIGTAHSADGRLWTTVVFIKMAPIEVAEILPAATQPAPPPPPAARQAAAVAAPRSPAELVAAAAPAPPVVAEVETGVARVLRPQRVALEAAVSSSVPHVAANRSWPSPLVICAAVGNIVICVAAMRRRRSLRAGGPGWDRTTDQAIMSRPL